MARRWDLLAATVVGGVAASVVARRFVDASFVWLMWADRDLVRSAVTPWSVLGAELSYGAGARVPGGLVHQLMGLPLALGDGPLGVYRWMLVLDLLGLVALGAVLWRLGPLAAAVGISVAVLSPASTDNLDTLWNPGYLPLFATLAWAAAAVALERRDGRPLVVGAVAAALGCQLHLSAGLLGAALALAVAPPLRATVPWRWLVAGVVVPYAPYALYEATTGFSNTALLLQQRQVADALSGRAAWDNLPPLLGWLGGATPTGALAAWSRPWGAALAHGVVVVGLLGALGEAGVRGRVGRLAAAGALAAGYYLLDPAVDLRVEGTGRYLQVVVPGLALVVGAGAASLARWRPWVSGLLAVSAVWQGYAWHARQDDADHDPMRWRALAEVEEALERAAGGDASAALGRSVLVQGTSRGTPWVADDAGAWFLYEDGQEFPGSSPPPCFAVLLNGGGPAREVAPVDERRLADVLGPVPALRLDTQQSLPGGHRLVRYHRAGLCATSWPDRYVLLPEEERLSDRYEELAADHLVPDGEGRFVGALDAYRRWDGEAAQRVALSLTVADDAVVLHSNQLRGVAHNAGPWLPARLDDAALVWTRGDEVVRHELAAGPVGLGGASTPIRVPVPAQARGSGWSLRLEGSVRRLDRSGRGPLGEESAPFVLHVGPVGAP